MLIVIGGPSCSGKTTLAEGLSGVFSESWDDSATRVSLDDHFKESKRASGYQETVWPFASYPDCDRYDAIDWEGALEGIEKALAIGHVVVDGFLALGKPEVRELSHRRYYVDVQEHDIIRQRRFDREPTHPPGYMENILLPRNDELVVPTREFADVVLNGELTPQELLSTVIKDLTRHLPL